MTNLVLYTGDFRPWLEDEFVRTVKEDLAARTDPLRDQVLVVVPTKALRQRLFHLLAAEKSIESLFGTSILTLNHLSMQIAFSLLSARRSVLSRGIFLPYALFDLARESSSKRFSTFRICQALYRTLRDLSDGGVSAELLSEVLEYARDDPDYARSVDFAELQSVAQMYGRLESFIETNSLLPLQFSSRHAAGGAERWLNSRNVKALHLFGFYDSTQSQFDLLESAVRVVSRDGVARLYFPLPVSDSGGLAHPASFARQFYDRLYSLNVALGGETRHQKSGHGGASGGVESLLFLDTTSPEQIETARGSHNIEFFSTSGAYDEAWTVAKKILHLVNKDGVRFDQIQVITRSMGESMLPLAHVFAENNIPCALRRQDRVAHLPAARFTMALLRAREARLNSVSLFELLSSPFLPGIAHREFLNIRKLMDECVIKNWDDWGRLTAVLNDPAAAPVFQRDEEEGIRALWKTANSLLHMKRLLQQIPERASLPQYADILRNVLQSICGALETPALAEVLEALKAIGDWKIFQNSPVTLSEFTDLLKQHLENIEQEAPEDDATAHVRVGDIMQLRGCSADYVFLIGLNQDVFPRRTQEDPFLPDNARTMLRAFTGAGPALRRGDRPDKPSLLPLKEGTEEELLLFALALRSADKRMFLSFQRANDKGQKLACSTYLDEVLRLLTGKTSEGNPAVAVIPRRQTHKFETGALPTPTECATIPAMFSASEILSTRHQLPASYEDFLRKNAARLNARDVDTGKIVDGCLPDTSTLWPAVLKRRMPDTEEKYLRLSYSRFKQYLQCPFSFYADEVLQLDVSPRDTEEAEHDLSPLLKGRMAEDVVKIALGKMREDGAELSQAVAAATAETGIRYSKILPSLLIEIYMAQFHNAALLFLRYLERQNFRLAASTTPGRDEMIEGPLVPAENGLPAITIRGIIDLLLSYSENPEVIGELKWGSKSVGNTPSFIFTSGEAQFCIYPELQEHGSGKRLPFRYFRLDAFHRYGAPDHSQQEIENLRPPRSMIKADTVLRVFGGEALPRGIAQENNSQEDFFDLCRDSGRQIQSGQFRILKDPSLSWAACRFCDFTQLCRKSHTATLLRSKRAPR